MLHLRILVLALLLGLPALAMATSAELPPTVAASGEGRVEVAPDIAWLSFGVSARQPTVAAARDEVARGVARLITLARQQGLEDEHIATAALSVSPEFDWHPETRERRLQGYVVSRQVTLRLAAREASIWNNPAAGHAALEQKIGVLRQRCEEIDRDPAEVTVSQQCLVTLAGSDEEAEPMIQLAQKLFGGHMGDPTGPLALSGTADRVSEQIQTHLDLGCTMFMIEFFGRDTREPAQLFAETVMPNFR